MGSNLSDCCCTIQYVEKAHNYSVLEIIRKSRALRKEARDFSRSTTWLHDCFRFETSLLSWHVILLNSSFSPCEVRGLGYLDGAMNA